MAFLAAEIEDGTGKPDGLVYSPASGDPVADAVSYLGRRGKVVFSTLATIDLQEAALVRAADYLGRAYEGQLVGERSTEDQRLPQPRRGQYRGAYYIPSDELPREWLEAWYEAAELSAGDEVFDVVADDQRRKTREALGRNAIEDEWAATGPNTQAKRFPFIDNILEPLLGMAGRYVRV